MPLDKDTATCLETVKRGTPARFVMVNKGAEVLSVVAFRKGSSDSATKRAKKLGGSGNVSFGVVNGSGANLVFNLATADGFTSEPVLATKLKAFLTAEEDFKNLKPTFQIVDQLPVVAMEESEGGEQETSESSLEESPEPSNDSPSDNNGTTLKYRSGESWKAVIDAVQKKTDPAEKLQAFDRVHAALVAEATQLKNDPYYIQNPGDAAEQADLIRKVNQVLNKIRPETAAAEQADTSLDSPANSPPNTPRQTGDEQPQVTDSPRPQIRRRAAAPNLQAAQQAFQQATPQLQAEQQAAERVALQKKLADRQAILDATKKRVGSVPAKGMVYNKAAQDKMLLDCEVEATDTDSQFGEILKTLNFSFNTLADGVEVGIELLQQAMAQAEQYIKDHKDPRIGKLKPRVEKRKLQCQQIIADCNAQLSLIDDANAQCKQLCESTLKLYRSGNLPPREVADQLTRLKQTNKMLTAVSKTALESVAAVIVRENQQAGFAALAQIPNPSPRDEAEVLRRYGCYKTPGGGTSDVKLLQQQDGSIAYAFKSAAGESAAGNEFLGDVPPGASSVREDLCFSLCDAFKQQTGIDLGFPKSEFTSLDGDAGALVEGIRGRTCDPEEQVQFTGMAAGRMGQAKAKVAFDALKVTLETVPDTLTQDSLENLVITSVMTGQWDCKWGNMMVDGDKARPIDGGTSFPTRHMVDLLKASGGPTPVAMLCYPDFNSKSGQPLPQTQQPMDRQKVKAILDMNVDAAIQASKDRRAQLLRDNPSLDPGVLTDECLGIVEASMKGSQKILRDNPGISAYDFAEKYTQWFMTWA